MFNDIFDKQSSNIKFELRWDIIAFFVHFLYDENG